MSSFTDAMQEIVNLSDENKVKLAGGSFLELMRPLAEFDKEYKGLRLILPIFGASAGADGKLTSSESALIRAITSAVGLELSEEKVLDLVKTSTRQETYDMMTSLSKVLDNDGRAALVHLVAALCAIDDKMSKEELALIASLLE